MMHITSKLPDVGTTIFTVVSKLAKEHNAINLGQGYPDFDCDDKLKALVSKHLNEGKNQYAPMPGIPELREVLAGKVDSLYDVSINPDTDICITAGATQAIFTAITAIVGKGDEVIIFDPSYDCYRPTVELMGAKPVIYQLEAPDFAIDWNKLATLVTDKTRMVIVNTPHNPLGKCFTKSDWHSLVQAIKNTNAVVLSDEVYEHLVYDNQQHESVLKQVDLRDRFFAVYSFGKTFHNTGWKMGYCIAPRPLMNEFKKVHQYNVFSVNSFVQYALADYLNDPSTYLGLADFYQTKRDYFEEQMQTSRFKALPCEGSYFQVYDYSGISDLDDLAFAKIMAKETKVACIPVSAFYSVDNTQRLVRFCFAKTKAVLEEATHRLTQV